MLQLTLRETFARDESLIETELYRLYVLRDPGQVDLFSAEGTVFYVGQSANPYDRLLFHLGLSGRTGPSHVGEFLLENAPASGAWLFEQYTIEEGRPFVEQYRATLPVERQAFYRATGNRYGVTDAERAMIKLYRPCLNTAHNSDPTPLPTHYKRRSLSAKNPHGEKLAELFGVK